MKINFQSGRVYKVRRDTNINMSLSGEQTYIEKILSENLKNDGDGDGDGDGARDRDDDGYADGDDGDRDENNSTLQFRDVQHVHTLTSIQKIAETSTTMMIMMMTMMRMIIIR